MTNTEIIDRIRQLKKEKNAVILAHYYTRPEVQDIADYLGDSLGLSQEAGKTDARIIVFCGVHFMAETAAIISPDKKILIPALGAGCSLAESITGYELREWKKANPDGIIVSYVNTTAEVKAWTDICCTSANALKVVQSIPPDRKILFVPDKNLGAWIRKVTGREMEQMLGIFGKDMEMNWNDVVFKGLTIQGVYGRKMFETWYKMSAMIQGGLDLEPIITHRFKYTDYEKGFEAMATGRSGKVILDWRK